MFNDLFPPKGRVALVSARSRGTGKMIAAGFLDRAGATALTLRLSNECDLRAIE
jgi:NAD(P)-dependent dehydrogenase (short-subunit alcohol dehydrogenase family)